MFDRLQSDMALNMITYGCLLCHIVLTDWARAILLSYCAPTIGNWDKYLHNSMRARYCDGENTQALLEVKAHIMHSHKSI